MRSLLLLTVLAACELKPPPPKAQPAPGSGSAAPLEAKAPVTPTALPVTVPPPTPPMPPVVNAGSGSGSAVQPVISEGCQQVAIHITDILVANADPTQRAFLEQERARTVRQSGLSCQRNNWNDDKIKCFAAAGKFADLDACNKLP